MSRVLLAYYRHLSVPAKLRWWGMARRATGNRRLTIPYAGRGRITVDESDWLQQIVLEHGAYEPEVWDALAAHARPGDVFWDVGAYIGTVAIRALLDTRVGEVHCFEPNPRTLEILKLNLSLNSDRFVCHELALSGRSENRRLADVSEANAGMATLVSDDVAGGTWVRCMAADDVVQRRLAPPPDLLKIDVEDSEESLLIGASTLLATTPPRAIVVEAAAGPDGAMLSGSLRDLLDRSNYSVARIKRPDGTLMERENYLAIHTPSG